MDDLSLFLLDIVENSLNANASMIIVIINEDDLTNKISITVSDNGKGMDKETLRKAIDPFFTTRTTRKVGLGLSLLKQTCEGCDGTFSIDSTLGVGTNLFVTFRKDHIDTPPIGQMSESIISILLHPRIKGFRYKHIVNEIEFEFDLKEVLDILGDVSLQDVEVITFIKNYIKDNIDYIRGGVK
ncbi:MAG: ATP-binding protein [Acholeplasmataceae bacterium]|jgi:hypothetical protein|nr:ATP-binding protein [Candidatus Izemoplasmatales bacterium]